MVDVTVGEVVDGINDRSRFHLELFRRLRQAVRADGAETDMQSTAAVLARLANANNVNCAVCHCNL
jgi:hypothetical protein